MKKSIFCKKLKQQKTPNKMKVIEYIGKRETKKKTIIHETHTHTKLINKNIQNDQHYKMIRNSFKIVESLCSTVRKRKRKKGEVGKRKREREEKHRRKYRRKFQAEITNIEKINF